MSKYKISPGLTLMAAMEPSQPTAESLKDNIFGLVLDEDGNNVEVLKHLVAAYSQIISNEADDEDKEVEFVSDSDDWAAEKLYREYCIKGWKNAMKRRFPQALERDDDSIYESCPWYDFGKMTWPAQLIVEVGFLLGYKAGREAIGMHDYVVEQQAKHGDDWRKYD